MAALTLVDKANMVATARSFFENRARYGPPMVIDGIVRTSSIDFWHSYDGLYTWIQVNINSV